MARTADKACDRKPRGIDRQWGRQHLDALRELLDEVALEAVGVESLLIAVAAVPHGHGRLSLLGGDRILVDDAH